MCGTDLACLADHIPHLLDTVDNAEINEFLTQLQSADLADPIARQLMDQIVALQRTAQTAYGVTPQSATNGFAYTYGPDANIVENRSVNAVDGCVTCRPDIMVYDPDTGTLHVVEAKNRRRQSSPKPTTGVPRNC